MTTTTGIPAGGALVSRLTFAGALRQARAYREAGDVAAALDLEMVASMLPRPPSIYWIEINGGPKHGWDAETYSISEATALAERARRNEGWIVRVLSRPETCDVEVRS